MKHYLFAHKSREFSETRPRATEGQPDCLTDDSYFSEAENLRQSHRVLLVSWLSVRLRRADAFDLDVHQKFASASVFTTSPE